jgi:hypothetical protein
MNINDNSSAANGAKGTTLTMPALCNSFSNAVAHLAMTLQMGQARDTRNISSINSGRGEGRGRSCGSGCSQGRGQGRGQNVYLGSYSPDQWRHLSAEDKKRGQQKAAEQKSQGNTIPGNTGTRRLA